MIINGKSKAADDIAEEDGFIVGLWLQKNRQYYKWKSETLLDEFIEEFGED